MKHKTLFRLMLKAVGVLLFCQGISQLTTSIGSLLIELLNAPGGGVVYAPFPWAWVIGSALLVSIGLYLFFGGKWLADKAIPGNRPYCHECGYDLTGAVEHRCPECDTPFQPRDVAPPRRDADPDAR